MIFVLGGIAFLLGLFLSCAAETGATDMLRHSRFGDLSEREKKVHATLRRLETLFKWVMFAGALAMAVSIAILLWRLLP